MKITPETENFTLYDLDSLLIDVMISEKFGLGEEAVIDLTKQQYLHLLQILPEYTVDRIFSYYRGFPISVDGTRIQFF